MYSFARPKSGGEESEIIELSFGVPLLQTILTLGIIKLLVYWCNGRCNPSVGRNLWERNQKLLFEEPRDLA